MASVGGVPSGSNPLPEGDMQVLCYVCTDEMPFAQRCQSPSRLSDGSFVCERPEGNRACSSLTICCEGAGRTTAGSRCGPCLDNRVGEQCLMAETSEPMPIGGGATDTNSAAGGTLEDVGGQTADSGGDAAGQETPGDDPACDEWANLTNLELQRAIHRTLSTNYRPITVQVDLGGNPNRYTTARTMMFSRVERGLPDAGDGQLECLYTGSTASTPVEGEPDRTAINCEHVWPRSRMVSEEGQPVLYEHQQSDIHTLMPSDPNANSARGSLRFGVVSGQRNLDYAPSVVGTNSRGERVFQPRPDRQGDVARMVFYFSVRWGLSIQAQEAIVLRQWHEMDPTSDRERMRNDRTEAVQGNRNPFVDCPSLVDRIDRFDAFESQDTDGSLPFP